VLTTHRLQSRLRIPQFWWPGNEKQTVLELDGGGARLQSLAPRLESYGLDPRQALALVPWTRLEHPGTFRFQRFHRGRPRLLLYVQLVTMPAEEKPAVQNVVSLEQGYSH
jgi:hypothetical protein